MKMELQEALDRALSPDTEQAAKLGWVMEQALLTLGKELMRLREQERANATES